MAHIASRVAYKPGSPHWPWLATGETTPWSHQSTDEGMSLDPGSLHSQREAILICPLTKS